MISQVFPWPIGKIKLLIFRGIRKILSKILFFVWVGGRHLAYLFFAVLIWVPIHQTYPFGHKIWNVDWTSQIPLRMSRFWINPKVPRLQYCWERLKPFRIRKVRIGPSCSSSPWVLPCLKWPKSWVLNHGQRNQGRHVESAHDAGSLRFQLRALDVINTEGMTKLWKPDPFFEVQRLCKSSNGSKVWDTVFRLPHLLVYNHNCWVVLCCNKTAYANAVVIVCVSALPP